MLYQRILLLLLLLKDAIVEGYRWDVEEEFKFTQIDQFYFKISSLQSNLQFELKLKPFSSFTVSRIPVNIRTKDSIESKTEDPLTCILSGKVVGYPDSYASISRCPSLRGFIDLGTGQELVLLNDGGSSPANMNILRIIDSNSSASFLNGSKTMEQTRLLARRRRSTIESSFQEDASTRFIELVLVNDAKQVSTFEQNVLLSRTQEIAAFAHQLFLPLNIQVILVGVELWTKDAISIENSSDRTMASFLEWRRHHLTNKYPQHDAAYLITGLPMDGNVVGKAPKATICQSRQSGGVVSDRYGNVVHTAMTLAHELGHNLGLEHDDRDGCVCSSAKQCIMASTVDLSGSLSMRRWSSCSQEELQLSFEENLDLCLLNRPTTTPLTRYCGNGVLEEGEGCDCGMTLDDMPSACPCCNRTTCQLLAGATCAQGLCCDTSTCQNRQPGYLCRAASNACDLPEYCRGSSFSCPDDVYKEDGSACASGSFCARGDCGSRSQQCAKLWGPTGREADPECFKYNVKGDLNGHCGYDYIREEATKCALSDVMCGLLHCTHKQEKLRVGNPSYGVFAYLNISKGRGDLIVCRAVTLDFGSSVRDPGLAPEGSACGDGEEDRMCWEQKCTPVRQMRTCKQPCGDRGVCNNRGHCHCDAGYDPLSDCVGSGAGGSIDSGPMTAASSANVTIPLLITGAVILMLGLVAGAVLYFCRHRISRERWGSFYVDDRHQREVTYRPADPSPRRDSNPRRVAIPRPTRPAPPPPPPPHPPQSSPAAAAAQYYSSPPRDRPPLPPKPTTRQSPSLHSNGPARV